MSEFLNKVSAFFAPLFLHSDDYIPTPGDVMIRLSAALALAGAVVWIYKQTRAESEVIPSFTRTLVLLAILVAMVTQVIGTNTARAFGLVGALSIVRFRTVVRDTQDTAFVICAVAMGMAAGAGWTWVALNGLVVIAVATFLMRRGRTTISETEALFTLTVKMGLGHDVNTLMGPTFSTYLRDLRLLSLSTAAKGTALEVSYDCRLIKDGTADDLVSTLNKLEGVQDVEFERKAADGD